MCETDKPLEENLEYILRTSPEIIYSSNKKNSEEIQKIMKTYRDKDIEIKAFEEEYTTMIEQNPGKNILILGDEKTGKQLRKNLYKTNISLEK